MKTMIYPHQYNYIRSVILRLKNVYKTVNDKEEIKVIQSKPIMILMRFWSYR